MKKNNSVDPLKIIHWLNVRKSTFDVLNSYLKDKINFVVNKENLDELDAFSLEKIAEFLDVPKKALTTDNSVPAYMHHTKSQIEKQKDQSIEEVYIFIIIIPCHHHMVMSLQF